MDWPKLKALGPSGPSFPRALWSKQPSDISPNAWIDGVRGLAALIVTLDHLFWHLIGPLFQGWKSFPPDAHSSLLQLPGLSIIFSARAMVPLFFVISGYCISLSSIRARSATTTNPSAPLLTILSTSVFRRGLRLMLPVAAIALFSQLVYACGGYDAWPEHFDAASLPSPDDDGSISSPFAHARYLIAYAGSLFDQVLTGTRCQGMGTADCPVGLNGQLWTIPLELRGSFVVYLCVLGLARTRATPRKWVLASLAAALLWRGWWEGATFVAGLLIAELTAAAADSKGEDNSDNGPSVEMEQREEGDDDDGEDLILFSPATEPPAWLPLRSSPSSYDRWSTTIQGAAAAWMREESAGGKRWWLTLGGRHRIRRNARSAAFALVGVWLLCFPNDPDIFGGYGPCYTFLMTHLSPTRWFVSEGGGAGRAEFCWRAVGGVAFVAAIAGNGSVSAVLRRPFCSSAAQYFGRISFMLYLVHIMVIQCTLYRVQAPLVEVLGEERGWAAGVVARLVLLPPMFWVSEVLVEGLDRRSIGLAKWLSRAWLVEER